MVRGALESMAQRRGSTRVVGLQNMLKTLLMPGGHGGEGWEEERETALDAVCASIARRGGNGAEGILACRVMSVALLWMGPEEEDSFLRVERACRGALVEGGLRAVAALQAVTMAAFISTEEPESAERVWTQAQEMLVKCTGRMGGGAGTPRATTPTGAAAARGTGGGSGVSSAAATAAATATDASVAGGVPPPADDSPGAGQASTGGRRKPRNVESSAKVKRRRQNAKLRAAALDCWCLLGTTMRPEEVLSRARQPNGVFACILDMLQSPELEERMSAGEAFAWLVEVASSSVGQRLVARAHSDVPEEDDDDDDDDDDDGDDNDDDNNADGGNAQEQEQAKRAEGDDAGATAQAAAAAEPTATATGDADASAQPPPPPAAATSSSASDVGEEARMRYEQQQQPQQRRARAYSTTYVDGLTESPEAFELAISRVRDLRAENSKKISKRDRKELRLRFRQYADTVVHGMSPYETFKIRNTALAFEDWASIKQLNALRGLLREGFNTMVRRCETVQDVLDIPDDLRRGAQAADEPEDERWLVDKSSSLGKARTERRTKDRRIRHNVQTSFLSEDA